MNDALMFFGFFYLNLTSKKIYLKKFILNLFLNKEYIFCDWFYFEY